MTIGEKIRACREAKHLTQTELGLTCGVAKQTIFKYETGVVTNIPLDKLKLMASALGVSAAYLMGWEDAPDSKEKPSEDKKTAPELSESVKKLISVMSQLTPENQRIVLAAAKGFLQEQNEGEDK